MKKWTALGLVLFFLALTLIGFSHYVNTRLDERRAVVEMRRHLEAEAKKASYKHTETAWTSLERLVSLENLLEFVEKVVASMPKQMREAIGPSLRVKLFESYFRRAELLLGRAGDLLRKDENHPTGKEYIERARKIYTKMEVLMDAGIPARSGDVEENARLNYMKGVYYYRSLIFIKDPKAEAARAEELVGLSAKHLSAVFPYKPKNWDTEVAFEILQKRS